MPDAPEVVDEAGDTVVGAADHGAAVFRAAEDGVGEVLASGGAAFEPSGIGHGNEELRPEVGGTSGEVAEGVLEADQRSKGDRRIGEMKNDRTIPGIKVIRHHVPDNDGKEREAVSEGDVFAEHDEVGLGIKLWRVVGSGQQDGGVVVALVAEAEGAKKEGMVPGGGPFFDELVGHAVFEESPGGGRFRPEEEVRLQGDGHGCLTVEGVIDALLEGGVPLFVLRDGWLDRGHAQGDGLAGAADLAESVAEGRDDEGDGDGEIEVRADFSAAGFDHQSAHGGHGDG